MVGVIAWTPCAPTLEGARISTVPSGPISPETPEVVTTSTSRRISAARTRVMANC